MAFQEKVISGLALSYQNYPAVNFLTRFVPAGFLEPKRRVRD